MVNFLVEMSHFAYCEARGDDFIYEIDLKNLKKCFESNYFLCLKCQKTFKSIGTAHNHMVEQEHTPSANNKWRPMEKFIRNMPTVSSQHVIADLIYK